jgi:hypothetical protein
MAKCARTVCNNPETVWKNTVNGEFYCNGCALRMNDYTPGLLIRDEARVAALLDWRKGGRKGEFKPS